MTTPVHLCLIAGLSIAGIRTAAADSDVAVWRWHVSNVLRAQQNRVDQPRPLGNARATESGSGFIQRNGRYLADGSPAPMGDPAHR